MTMANFILSVSVIFAIIVIIGYFNERITHLTYEIALLLFSILIGCVITIIYAAMNSITVRDLLDHIQVFNLEKFSTLFTWGGLRGGLSIALAMSMHLLCRLICITY